MDNDDIMIDNQIDNLLLLKLNPYSYEQGFFLYYANTFFKVDGLKEKKIQRKFGTEDDYFSKLF